MHWIVEVLRILVNNLFATTPLQTQEATPNTHNDLVHIGNPKPLTKNNNTLHH